MNRTWAKAFTIVELLIVIAVLAIVATVTITSYGEWRRQTSDRAVESDLRNATSALHSHKNFKDDYPPNLAGTGFISSSEAALVLLTNAPSIGVYENLTNAENAQLFLNACNANITDTPNNTTCSFQGNGGGAKIHVAGTQASNAIWQSPINESDVVLNCGTNQAICNQVLDSLKSQFTAQGGVFPIFVPGNNIALPEPTLVPNGRANRFCMEGRSQMYTDIVYHTSSENEQITQGPCPEDPTLHYYQ